MPAFDGTGPMGQGSMTGRGMGYCAVPVRDGDNPNQVSNPTGYANAPRVYPYGGTGARRFYPFRGFGRGRGRGFARRRWF